MAQNFLYRCMICHSSGEIFCHACQRHLRHYEQWDSDHIWGLTWLVIGRHYDRLVRQLITHLKYGKGRKIAHIIGSKLATLIYTTELIGQIQTYAWQVVITAVPTHWIKKYFTRWYNQSELLAKSIAWSLELPYISLLHKSHWTTSQVLVRDRKKRLINVVDSFSSSSQTWSWSPAVIIIVDDIITTWATIGECARILHDQYPHSQIRWVCIARNR